MRVNMCVDVCAGVYAGIHVTRNFSWHMCEGMRTGMCIDMCTLHYLGHLVAECTRQDQVCIHGVFKLCFVFCSIPSSVEAATRGPRSSSSRSVVDGGWLLDPSFLVQLNF